MPYTVEIGPFRLVNPPEGAAEVIAEAVRRIEFPWPMLDAYVDADDDRAVLVEWGDTGQGVSGLFYGYGARILLSNLDRDLGPAQAFVFAHEVGHLVDRAVLDDEARAALLAIMHPGIRLGHFDHDHPDAGHDADPGEWSNGGDAYVSRVYEAFADLFVAAFAPSLWDGSAFGIGRRWPRFVHWTDDLDAVRRYTLAAGRPDSKPAPVPARPARPRRRRLRALRAHLRRVLRRWRRRVRRGA